MGDLKRTIEKSVTTRVKFSHEEVKALLANAAGVPASAQCQLNDEYGDEYYGGMEIVWTTNEVVEDE